MHRASHTIHVDDTLMYLELPLPLRLVGWRDSLAFHPTLARALQRHAGAASEFRDWARELIENWRDADNLCAAHTAPLLARTNRGQPIPERLEKALRRCEPKLRLHERRFG